MWNRLSLRSQIMLGFGAVIAVFVVFLVATGLQLMQLRANIEKIDSETLPFILIASDMNLARSETQQFLTDSAATHEPDGIKEAEVSAKRFMDNAAMFKAMFQAEGDHDNINKLQIMEKAYAAYVESGKHMVNIYIDQGTEAGNKEMEKFDGAAESLEKLVGHFRDQQIEEARKITGHTVDMAVRMGWSLIAAVVLASIVAGVIGTLVAMSVLRLLGAEPREAAQLARDVGAGNLTITPTRKAVAPDSLMANLQAMQQNLHRVVTRIRQTSDTVASAAVQIATGNGDLAQRTSAQASSLEEAASAMEQMGSAVETNAQNGQHATQLARQASDVAEQGGTVVNQVVATMTGINEASRRIADIIGVIDSIAFQTNILALNAAVEAARAGEQGRGFAVVASEVRALAQRSAQAAREIKELIQASVSQVEAGTELVDRAGQTMADVVGAIRKVTDLIGEISVASHEQAQGVTQMGQTVQGLDRDTQQNATLVEEMDASARSLNDQAQKLVHIVSVFKT